jgi:signal transduction histidine kinase
MEKARDTGKVDLFMGARRSILLAGAFAALLVVIGVSATAVWWNARTAQEQLTELHNTHAAVNAALASIRADIYLTGILTRDYLLDDQASVDRQYLAQFDGIREDTERNFKILDRSRQDEEQRVALERLRREIQVQYWDPTVEALAWTPQEKQENRRILLSKLVKRRQEVVALATEVEKLIATSFLREQQRAATAGQEFRSSFGWITIVALFLGLGISMVALTRMTSLERQSHEAESELRRLSAQIRMTQEQERKNLSRELHDEVGQLLTGLRMELGGLTRANADNSELALRVENSKRTVEHLIRSVRNIALILRPSMLDDLGLSAALGWLVKESSRSSGIDIQAQLDGVADSLPDAHRTCLYRVVQEALTNVVRHSGARKCEVEIQTVAGWVTAGIFDDGRGFDTGSGKERGLGLIGMEERVKELGGSFRVSSSPGRGTRVEIRLPRPAETEAIHAKGADSRRSRDRSGGLEASA